MTKKGTKTFNKKEINIKIARILFYNKNSLNESNCDHIVSIFVYFQSEYFNNQVTRLRSGPVPVPGKKIKRDWDRNQPSGQKMTGTGTGPSPVHGTGTGPGTGPKTFSGHEMFVFKGLGVYQSPPPHQSFWVFWNHLDEL